MPNIRRRRPTDKKKKSKFEDRKPKNFKKKRSDLTETSTPKKRIHGKRPSQGARPQKRQSQKVIRDPFLCYIEEVDGEIILRSTNKKINYTTKLPNQDSYRKLINNLAWVEVYDKDKLPKIFELPHQVNQLNEIYKISIESHQLPHEFSKEALKEVKELEPFKSSKSRTDFTHLPFVTVDGADAKDFDDAVYAAPDDDPRNKGGWNIKIAIADVAHYVAKGSALDRDALERGNSVYFPGFVVPMLPERLSNDLCSLRPNEIRPTLVASLKISQEGGILKSFFDRGIIRSHERLTYVETHDRFEKQSGKFLKEINNLYGAFKSLYHHRTGRDTLDLDMPEQEFMLNQKGEIYDISLKDRLDSHRLIEEFMIAANIAAAKTLSKRKAHCLFRNHEAPPQEKFDDMLALLKNFGLAVPAKAKASAEFFNKVLHTASTDKVGDNMKELIQLTILRSQSQAKYQTDNLGHFGLDLDYYGHFTSPIRRYSDLIVHRLLIDNLKLGEGGAKYDDLEKLNDIADHINQTERNAFKAEMSTKDRLLAHYLQDKTGQKFDGRIMGLNRFNLYVSLPEMKAEGVLPIENMPKDRYFFDMKNSELKGRNTRRSFKTGDQIKVIIDQTDPIRGAILLKLI